MKATSNVQEYQKSISSSFGEDFTDEYKYHRSKRVIPNVDNIHQLNLNRIIGLREIAESKRRSDIQKAITFANYQLNDTKLNMKPKLDNYSFQDSITTANFVDDLSSCSINNTSLSTESKYLSNHAQSMCFYPLSCKTIEAPSSSILNTSKKVS